jgi:hypothetical protein
MRPDPRRGSVSIRITRSASQKGSACAPICTRATTRRAPRAHRIVLGCPAGGRDSRFVTLALTPGRVAARESLHLTRPPRPSTPQQVTNFCSPGVSSPSHRHVGLPSGGARRPLGSRFSTPWGSQNVTRWPLAGANLALRCSGARLGGCAPVRAGGRALAHRAAPAWAADARRDAGRPLSSPIGSPSADRERRPALRASGGVPLSRSGGEAPRAARRGEPVPRRARRRRDARAGGARAWCVQGQELATVQVPRSAGVKGRLFGSEVVPVVSQ